MQDRIPTYPGRVKLTPVTGQTNVYDMAREDAPTEPGTALNKANLLSDETETVIWGSAANRTVNDALNKLGGEVWQIGDVRTTVSNTLDDSWLLANGGMIGAANYPILAPMLPYAVSQVSSYTGTTLTASTSSGRSLSKTLYSNGYYIIKDSSYGYLYYTQNLSAGFQSVLLSPPCAGLLKHLNGFFMSTYFNGSTHQILWGTSPDAAWSYASVVSGSTYQIGDFTYDGTNWAATYGTSVYCASSINGAWSKKATLPQISTTGAEAKLFSGNGYTVANYSSSYSGAYYTTDLTQTTVWSGTSAVAGFLGFVGGKFWGYVIASSGVYDIYVGDTPITMTTKIGTILTNVPVVGSVQYDNGTYYVRSSSTIYTTADMTANSLKSLSDVPSAFDSINTPDKCIANGTLMQITTTKVYTCPINNRLLPSISVSGAYSYIKGV
ncbi:MAG: hypothetical protein VB078_00480 [Clostridiaceae bacterium]|nr:hypothetical protein [Clostridiaceae bacterium]